MKGWIFLRKKARDLCEKLLEEKILEVRSGDGGVGQQATNPRKASMVPVKSFSLVSAIVIR